MFDQPQTGASGDAQMQRFLQMLQGLQNPQQRQQYAMQLAQQMPAPPPEAMQGFQPMLPGQVPQPQPQLGGLINNQWQMPPQAPSLGQFITPGFVPQGVPPPNAGTGPDKRITLANVMARMFMPRSLGDNISST